MHWAPIGESTITSQHMINALRAQHRLVSQRQCRPRGRLCHSPRHCAVGHRFKRGPVRPGPSGGLNLGHQKKHRDQAQAAIAAGKPVLCEKPLAMTVADAAAVVCAGRFGHVLSLGLFNAVYLPEDLHGWQINSAAEGGNFVPDITGLDADVVRFLLGEDPQKVVAQMPSSGMGQGGEDSAVSVWSRPSGAMVHGTEGSIFARGVMARRPGGNHQPGDSRQSTPFPEHNLCTFCVAQLCATASAIWDGVKSLAFVQAVHGRPRTALQRLRRAAYRPTPTPRRS